MIYMPLSEICVCGCVCVDVSTSSLDQCPQPVGEVHSPILLTAHQYYRGHFVMYVLLLCRGLGFYKAA